MPSGNRDNENEQHPVEEQERSGIAMWTSAPGAEAGPPSLRRWLKLLIGGANESLMMCLMLVNAVQPSLGFPSS